MIPIQNLSSFGNNFKCSISIHQQQESTVLEEIGSTIILKRIAKNLALLHRAPLPSANDEDEEGEKKLFCISPEEMTIFMLVNQMANKNFIYISPQLPLQPKFQKAKMAAFLFLATTIKTQTGHEIIPRCDAAGFGATFALYSVENKFKSTNEHSFALVWTIMITSTTRRNNDEEEKFEFALSSNQECGYIRLAKSVRKAAWILWMSPTERETEVEEGDFVSRMLSSFDFEFRKLC
jgi:hypothetical protein